MAWHEARYATIRHNTLKHVTTHTTTHVTKCHHKPQHVTTRLTMFQQVTTCRNMTQYVTTRHNTSQMSLHVTIHTSKHIIAARRNMSQHVTTHDNTPQHSTTRHNKSQHVPTRHKGKPQHAKLHHKITSRPLLGPVFASSHHDKPAVPSIGQHASLPLLRPAVGISHDGMRNMNLFFDQPLRSAYKYPTRQCLKMGNTPDIRR